MNIRGLMTGCAVLLALSSCESSTPRKRTPVQPDATQVRLWLCGGGNYVFDGELCESSSIKDIQEKIRSGYPAYHIVAIERTREDDYTVYYVTLKHV